MEGLNRGVFWFYGVFLALVSLAAALLFFLSGSLPAKAAAYGQITGFAVSVGDKTKSAQTTLTAAFTITTEIPASGGRVYLRFRCPTSYDNSASYDSNQYLNFDNAAIHTDTSPSSFSIYSRGGNYIVLSTTAKVSANTAVSIKLSSVKMPSTGGYCSGKVNTTNYNSALDGNPDWEGDYQSGFFEIGTNTLVTGTITENDGTTAVPYANVNLRDSSYSKSSYTTTDKDGKYGFADIKNGDWIFSVNKWSGYSTGKVYFSPDEKTINISGATTANASFKPTPKKLKGLVTLSSPKGTPVKDATVSVSSNSGTSGGYASQALRDDGSFAFELPGGTWSLYLSPSSWPAGWRIPNNQTITFVNDASSEEKTHNVEVAALTSKLTGSFQRPDGTAISQYEVSLSASDAEGFYYGGQFDQTGGFEMKVGAGTYSFSCWVSNNDYACPKMKNVTVGDNESLNIGVVKLAEKKDSIKATVKDNEGTLISGAYVNAWVPNSTSYEWASCTTGSDGTCSMKVTPQKFKVSSWPPWNSSTGGQDYSYTGGYQDIEVKSGVAATVSFTYQKNSAEISGTIVDPDGKVITTLNSWVGFTDESSEWSNIGASVQNGRFTAKVPPQTWKIVVYIWGSDFDTPDPIVETVKKDEKKTVTIKALANKSSISGEIKDEKGKLVTPWLSVFATRGRHGSWKTAELDGKGRYKIKVSKGTWRLSWSAPTQGTFGYSSGVGQDVDLEVSENQDVSYNIELRENDSKISGQTYKADGKTAQPWQWIELSTRDPNTKKEAKTYYYGSGVSSDQRGYYEAKLPSGTYWVQGYSWNGSGLIRPAAKKVTIDKDNSASVDLVYREADAKIKVTVKKDGAPSSAFVSAWGEDGAAAEGSADLNNGETELSVTSGTKWHIKAVSENGKTVHKSSERVVDLTDPNNGSFGSVELELKKQSYTLPDSVSKTFDPTVQNSIKLDDGFTMLAPANSIATTGTVTVNIDPTSTLNEEPDAKPVKGYGQEITVSDENNATVSDLNGEVTIVAEYTAEDLLESNILDEKEVIIGWYDTANSTWRELENCAVDSDENVVTCSTDHFTKFALIAAADTTPPAAPTNIKARDLKVGGLVRLTFTKPLDNDFASIKIYRSTAKGQIGSSIATGLKEGTHDDRGVDGTTYFYTVKAVDVSGNESLNTDQVSAIPTTVIGQTVEKTLGELGLSLSGPQVLPETGTPPADHRWSSRLSFFGLFGPLLLFSVLRRRPVSRVR